MRERFTTYILLLLLSCSTVSYAFTYEPPSQPASWSTTTTFSDDVCPSYTFRSTSSYTPIVGNTSYMSDGSGPISSPHRAKSWSPWDDPEDDPMGTASSLPVGEPYILLLMALGYFAYRRLHFYRKK